MNIQGVSLTPAWMQLAQKPLDLSRGDGGQLLQLQSTVAISKESHIKYDFLQRLREAQEGASTRASQIALLADKYGAIRSEIVSAEGEAQKQSLALLDAVYNEVTGEGADKLAAKFEQFFDGAGGESLFDQDAFRSHLLNLAQQAKQVAVEHPGETAERLLSAAPSTTLEQMSYSDIVALYGFIEGADKKEFRASASAAEFGQEVAEWHLQNRQSLALSGLSGVVRKAAEKALDAIAENELKKGAFAQTMNQFDTQIEEMRKKIAKFALQVANLNAQFNGMPGLDPADPSVQRLLRREETLMQGQAEAKNDLKKFREEKEKLKINPALAVETDAYKNMKKSYIAGMETTDIDK